ncbi:MAG: hypothetical protein ACOYIQ_05120 [Christensenellales bacterium]|jgi:hypothetical protein
MTVSEKYFLSAEIANKVRREKRVKSDYAVPGKLQYLLTEQIDPEEFFGDGQTGTGEIPFWWERSIPLNLSKREQKREAARLAQANRRLERQSEEIERASKKYIAKIEEEEKAFTEKIKRNDELIALKMQELESVKKRQEEEYRRAFYELELELQRERQERQMRERQEKGLRLTEQLKRDIAEKERLFAEKLAELNRNLERVREENELIRERMDNLVKIKGIPSEFVNFTKTGLIYAVPAENKKATSMISIYKKQPPKESKPAEKKEQKEKIRYDEDDSWYADNQFVPYKKDYGKVDESNLLEVKNLRVLDEDNHARLTFVNFFVRKGKNSVVYCPREEQADILFNTLTYRPGEGLYVLSGNISLAKEDILSPDICLFQDCIDLIGGKGKKAVKSIIKSKDTPDFRAFLQAFGLDYKKIMSAASRNLSEDELRITALCLALSSEAKLKIYNEPTLMLDNAQRDIFIGLAAREVSALFITTDDYFAANLKEALTFSL